MSKEFRIGLIALVSGVALYYGFNFLKGIDFFSKTSKYYAVYDKIDGLNKANPVIINGLKVGQVSNISLRQNFNNDVLVELDIDESIILTDSTVAQLAGIDLLGSKAIVLLSSEAGTRSLEPGDTVRANIEKGLTDLLGDEVQPVATNLNTTIIRINEILIGLKGSGEKINNTIGELEMTLKGVNQLLDNNQRNFTETIQSTASLIKKLDRKVDDLDPLLAKTGGVLDSLNNLELSKTLSSVEMLLDNLNNTILSLQEGNGTVGKLITNDSLYNNLNQSLIDLDRLLIHFNRYPRDFMKPLGRKHKKLKGLELEEMEKEN
ncbi:MAG: MCE family protein [Cyclobacteriaceae bacterium]|nr:MCE family protein [Cyclobacteriaceae bacterium HetDA_MAG_MS6]